MRLGVACNAAEPNLPGTTLQGRGFIDMEVPTFQIEPLDSRFRRLCIDGKFGAPYWNVDPENTAAACATLNMRPNEL
ncbi:hypothetical protein [Polyangium mundeleinium]|uniref:Uncharacterized protein n=1 Tax=Polyangium mundeleinium TaxID=2995306 RepID=A0ABT5EK09_9BACT|nr:hypothetical protein [Polyangium mundeleinium]MDC0742175.1 hypothetical protein [Polyangium mundeleinium]